MDLQDRLRTSLHAEADACTITGAGADAVRRKALRRHYRARRGIAAAGVVGLVGAGTAAWQHRPGSSVPVAVGAGSDLTAQRGSGINLTWRIVDNVVSYSSDHLTTANGVTYALSTAPGSAGGGGTGDGANVAEALYRTTDGVTWERADLGSDGWITDLSERNGVLYAVGTAPGTTPGATALRFGTSTNHGTNWSSRSLPVELSAPSALVPLHGSTSVQVASNARSTAVLATQRFFPDLAPLLASRFPSEHDLVAGEMGPDGFPVLRCTSPGADSANDPDGTAGAPPAAVATTSAPAGAKIEEAARRARPSCQPAAELGTISWASIGLNGPADLLRRTVLVSTDPTTWTEAALGGIGSAAVTELSASEDGFLALVDDQAAGGTGSPRVLASSDGTTWSPRAPVPLPGANVALRGKRVIAVDANGQIAISNDGAATWQRVDTTALVPGPAVDRHVVAMDAGPLGYAIVISVADPAAAPAGSRVSQVLFSRDGIGWDVVNLHDAGASSADDVTSVIVGADHVELTLVNATGVDTTSGAATRTLLATPRR